MPWLKKGFFENGQREDFGCVIADIDIIFLIGGRRGLNGLDRVDIWNTHKNKWFSGPRLPTEMKFCRAVLIQRFIYVLGTYNDFYRLNIDNMRSGWQRMSPAKLDGMGCELLTDGQRYIYRLGDTSMDKSFHRYDIQKNIWQYLPPMPQERHLTGATIVNDKIYVTGGRSGLTGDDILNSMIIYDIKKKIWKVGPRLPIKMFGHTIVAVNQNILLVCGGRKKAGSMRSLRASFFFNIHRNHWFQVDDSDLPQGLSGHSAVSQAMNVFVIGGSSHRADDYDNSSHGDIYMLPLKAEIRSMSCTSSITMYSSETKQSKSIKKTALTFFKSVRSSSISSGSMSRSSSGSYYLSSEHSFHS